MSLDSRVARLPYESSSFATSRGNERYEEKNRGVICFMYYSSISPFGGWRHHLSPHFVVGLWMLSHGAMSLQENIERPILPPEQGEVRRSRIGGSRAAANHQNANQAL